jgi:hypothetical protein
MTISTSNNVNKKKCEICGSNRTDIINIAGALVFRWYPYGKGTWMCGNCCRTGIINKARTMAFRWRKNYCKKSTCKCEEYYRRREVLKARLRRMARVRALSEDDRKYNVK